MKKFIIGFILGAILFSSIGVMALTGTYSIDVTYRDIKMVIDGETINADVEPFIYQGRTFVPIRWVAETLGMDVMWDEINQDVIMTTLINGESKYTRGNYLEYKTVNMPDDIYISITDLMVNKEKTIENALNPNQYETTTYKGFSAISYNNSYYVDYIETVATIGLDNVYTNNNSKTTLISTIDDKKQVNIELDNKNHIIKYQGKSYVNYSLLEPIINYCQTEINNQSDIVYKGKEYIKTSGEINNLYYFSPDGDYYTVKKKTDKNPFYHDTIIEKIPFTNINGKDYVELNYFKENIKPLIE